MRKVISCLVFVVLLIFAGCSDDSMAGVKIQPIEEAEIDALINAENGRPSHHCRSRQI